MKGHTQRETQRLGSLGGRAVQFPTKLITNNKTNMPKTHMDLVLMQPFL